MFKKLKQKLGAKGKRPKEAPSTSPVAEHPAITQAGFEFEQSIQNDEMQIPDESTRETQERLKQEFNDKWKNYALVVDHALAADFVPPGEDDPISDLILYGQSSKSETDTSSPNAAAMDRAVALVEEEYEDRLRPKPPPNYRTIELDPTGLVSYVYSPLQESPSIRLLRFEEDEYALPSSETQKICFMETFTLAQVPPYLALSYAWESSGEDPACMEAYKQVRDWIVNDGDILTRLEIGRNLYEGLQRITKTKTSTRYIWIDALCINQSDLRERASQVAMMDEIYSRCIKVIVWLGELDPDEAGDFYLLHVHVLPELVKYIQKHGPNSIKTGDWTLERLKERLGIRMFVEPQVWEIYGGIFHNFRWFHRAWVVQEIALAPEPQFMFAHLQLPWSGMLLMANFLGVSGLADDLFGPSNNLKSDFMRPGYVLELYNALRESVIAVRQPGGLEARAAMLDMSDPSRVSWDLFRTCISTMRNVQSKDPRDRIFAALGLLHLDKRNAGVIVPDYYSSTQDVFITATAILLKELPGLDILTKREAGPRQMRDLPSWVPDFTLPSCSPLHEEIRNSGPWPICRVEGPKLTLRGVAFTTAKALHVWETADQDEDSKSVSLLQTGLNSVVHLIQDNHTYQVDPLEVLWRTLIANKTISPAYPEIKSSHFRSFMALTVLQLLDNPEYAERAPESFGNAFPPSDSKPTSDWFKVLQETRNRVRTKLYPKAEDVAVVQVLKKETTVFLSVVERYMTNRQIYVTEQGLVGIGPSSMKKGDQIVWIQDSQFLFVMRERGPEYELIGETYLHGAMNGEMDEAGIERLVGDVVVS